MDKPERDTDAQKETILGRSSGAAINPAGCAGKDEVSTVGTGMKAFAKLGKGNPQSQSTVKNAGGVFNALEVALGGVSGRCWLWSA